MGYGFKVMLEGDYACFTRPEMKVERVSYDVPTPSALEGVLKSVYWKPAIRYVIDKIVVFNSIKFTNIRRNEVKEKVSFSKVKSAMKGSGKNPEVLVHVPSNINQRGAMLLKNVKYGVEFHFEMTGLQSEEDDNKEKHYNIISRRLKKGQMFKQAFLGCREFSINYIKLVDEFDYNLVDESLMGHTDLGYMLYGMNFVDNGRPKDDNWEEKKFSDEATPSFYRPIMEDGVIDVSKYREVM